MKKTTIFLPLLLVLILAQFQQAKAQVSGIGYTVSPTGERVWWDDKAGLEDGFLIGGKLGISFGEFLELRGTYMTGTGLKTDFSNYGFENYQDSLLTMRDVNMDRYGGELKANLSKGSFLPYVTIGTGIQSIQLDSMDENKQIYVSAGAGVKLSAGDRFTLAVEAKNTQYNFNSVRNLLTPEDRSLLEIEEGEFGAERLGNWSVSAALQFYLGGRRPGQMSDLDKAYMNTFADGLKGLRVPVELTLAKINFADDLPYRSTWMGGAYAGFDFSPYVGIRGFYLQAMEGSDINTKFEPLKMYGGELRMKLNVSRGLTPYVIVGGGYLNVDEEEYVGRDSLNGSAMIEDQAFALGGIGINLPLSKRFNIFGAARANITSNSTEIENLESTEQIQTSWMYSFGVNLNFGKKASVTNALDSRIEAGIQAQQNENDENAAKLKQEYLQKVVNLDKALTEAYAKGDLEKAAKLLQEKEIADKVVAELERREVAQQEKEATKQQQDLETARAYNVMPSTSNIQMSPAEFENLIEEILENMGPRGQGISPAVQQQMGAQNMQEILQQQQMEERIGEIEKLMIEMNARQEGANELAKAEQAARDEAFRRDLTEFSARLLAEMQKLSAKVDGKTSIEAGSTTVIETPATSTTPVVVDQNGNVIENPTVIGQTVTEGNVLGIKTGGAYLAQNDSSFFSKLTYEGMSGFAGFNLGGQTTANVGFRWHYGIGNSKFELMPEAFFGFGAPSAFGLTVNAVYPIAIKNTPVTPYLGAGAGFMQIASEGDDKLRLNYNFIIGTYLNVAKGRLFVDFTGRNAFKYNQIIAGYRFPF